MDSMTRMEVVARMEAEGPVVVEVVAVRSNPKPC